MMPNHNNESIVSVFGKLLGTLKKAKGVINKAPKNIDQPIITNAFKLDAYRWM